MADQPGMEAYVVAPESELADEHALVTRFVEETESAGLSNHQDVELKGCPAGVFMSAAKPDAARRYVIAAVEQTQHWDRLLEAIREQGSTESERINAHLMPGWQDVWRRRKAAAAIVKALTRKKLPFERADLLQMLAWCTTSENISSYWFPIGNIVRALQAFAASNEIDAEFASSLREFSKRIRSVYERDVKRYATTVDQLLPAADDSEILDEAETQLRPSPGPAAAGSPAVLIQLKRYLGIPIEGERSDVETTAIGGDEFALRSDSPLANEHEALTTILDEIVASGHYHSPKASMLKHGRLLTDPPDDVAAPLFLAAAERQIHSLFSSATDYQDFGSWHWRYAAAAAVGLVGTRGVPWTRNETFDAFLYLSTQHPERNQAKEQAIDTLLDAAEKYEAEQSLTEGERYALSLFRTSLVLGTALGAVNEQVKRATKLIGDGVSFCLAPGEVWSDLVNQDYSTWNGQERSKWNALFVHMLTSTTSRPSAKWLKTARETLEPIGEASLVERLKRWLPEVSKGRSVRQLGYYSGDSRGGADTMIDENATILRGLLWMIPTLKQRDHIARLVSAVTISAYKKVPGVGPRAVKVGNAGVYALSELGTTDAVGQLAILKVRVKFGTAQKEIEKAFTKTAEALELPRDEIEEMGVPSYGLTEVGRLTESLGDYTAEIEVTGSDAELRFRDAKEKTLKSVPAKVRKEYAEDLKDLRQSLKDISALLPAQRDRIDSMFLAQRTWPISAWRERYLDHPLVGTIARRLIWCVDGEPAVFADGKATAVDGSAVEHGETAEITLWHPVGRPVAEIVAWRDRLEQLQVTQPFKQAHREVYLLTAAEENTRTYSNRFAAHILRQHQFNALCSARGWKNQLRLFVDSSYAPPSKFLPQWNLRAEFWVEGIGDNYGVDTTESGSYLYLATDQVRFYRIAAAENWAHASGGGYTSSARGPGQADVNEPLPISEVPPLVFSEIMRDVDLFVGVASVGNDPNWQDGGAQGRYHDYWTSYSFGELSENATTRKAVLERLVPRLKIAKRCSFTDRFLVVQGDVRTYKIHLGSGNILMEPNDEYLCIVPDSRAKSNDDGMFLPFEGDRTLSIILSKALLLADDKKIKDQTILQQIHR